MSSDYLLSIIVPTRDRQRFAFLTACQVLSITSPEIQLVIQDNSSDNSLISELSIFSNDSRLKYNYSPDQLSFVDNFSLALSIADGEYVCMIGDDDGVFPEIVEITKWAHKNNVAAIKPEVSAGYLWPDSGIMAKSEKVATGFLTLKNIKNHCRISQTSVELEKLFKKGCQNYFLNDLVKIYHGIVQKNYFETIKKRTGRYFGGLSPDIYAVVALSAEIPEIVCIDYPLTISGVCRKSGSADSVTGKHVGELKNAPHLKGHNNYSWNSKVPEFYSVETIWADSALAAAKDIPMSDLHEKFSSGQLTAYLLKYKSFSSIAIDKYYDLEKTEGTPVLISRIKLVLAYLKGPVMDIFKKIAARLTGGNRNVFSKSGVTDIIQAEKELSLYLSSHEITIGTTINKLDILLAKNRN